MTTIHDRPLTIATNCPVMVAPDWMPDEEIDRLSVSAPGQMETTIWRFKGRTRISFVSLLEETTHGTTVNVFNRQIRMMDGSFPKGWEGVVHFGAIPKGTHLDVPMSAVHLEDFEVGFMAAIGSGAYPDDVAKEIARFDEMSDGVTLGSSFRTYDLAKATGRTQSQIKALVEDGLFAPVPGDAKRLSLTADGVRVALEAVRVVTL